MKPPCKNCPFRAKFKGDRDYLRPGRRNEIAVSILMGAEFPCHESVDYTDDEPDTSRGVPCVGLDLVQLRADRAGQMLRIRERLGVTDTDELLRRGRNIKLWTWAEVLADGEPDDDEGECCSICADGCEAPAGYDYGGEIVHGTDFLYADDICPTCDEHVCPSCMFHPDHECVMPRAPMRRSPRLPRKEETIHVPKAQRSAPRQ